MNINKQLLFSIAAVSGLVACSVENEISIQDEDKKAIWPKIVSQVPKDKKC